MAYDCIIIGSGPAGYTATIYAIRAGLFTLLIEGDMYGGQLMNTTDVDNYPGFSDGISGPELMMAMRAQCMNLGCTIISEDVMEVKLQEDLKSVTTRTTKYLARTIIIATGATAKKLDLGDTYWNRGISACAVCDGALPMFRGQPLAVVGGGDTACEEALFLSRFGSCVYLLIRGQKMRASHRMRQKVMANPKIIIKFMTQVVGVDGDGSKLTQMTLFDPTQTYTLDVSGLFYAIGHTPNTQFLNGALALDEAGYILTDHTKTSVPGVFACGDVQDKVYRQAITAAGTGCMAALEAEKYLS